MRKLCVAWLAVSLLAAGCNQGAWNFGTKGRVEDTPQSVPHPVDLLLPQTIRVHPFTGTRTFDEAGGIRGIDVRIEAVDAYGDATKAFGTFRFEMYHFVPNSLDPKGQRIATWTEDLLQPRKNVLHWDKITRTYQFRLQWDQAIPVGKKFVLLAYFTSPFTSRLDDQRVFTSGQ